MSYTCSVGDILPDLYLLFSHELTAQQGKEAYEQLGIEKIYYLPDNLKAIWSEIPPDIPSVSGYLSPVREWLKKQVKNGDYILIQGDFGATYTMVRWCFANNCKPIYATTRRKVVESRYNEEITKSRVFEHVRFRLYEEG